MTATALRFDSRGIPVRYSHLKMFARSPAHYRAAIETNFAPTRAMRIGTIVHALVLGGNLVVYDGERRGKAWAEFVQAHPQTEIVTRSEHDDATDIAAAVLANPLAMGVLAGEHEKQVAWRSLGRECSSRIDSADGNRVTELKVTNDSSPGRFSRLALRMSYNVQLAAYCDAVGAKEAFIVAVEATKPYPVTVMKLSDRALELGRRTWHLWMEQLLACEASGEFPGYCQSIVPFDVPDDIELDFDTDAPLPF